MVQVQSFVLPWDLLEVKHTLEDCLGFDVLDVLSWVFGHGRMAVDSGGGVVLGVLAFGQVSAP